MYSTKKPDRFLSSLDDDFVHELIHDEILVAKKRRLDQIGANDRVLDVIRRKRASMEANGASMSYNGSEALTPLYDLDRR